jgi:hypothetical protein
MKQQRPIRLGLVICVAAMGLAACQGLSDGTLFGTPQAAPPPACPVAGDDGRMKSLQAENLKLRKQLADAMRDNAMLRDLAVKKW